MTAEDYVLGLREAAVFDSEGGRVTLLEAGRATLELAEPGHAAYVDQVEVGRRTAGHIRVAFAVPDASTATESAWQAGATVLAGPMTTPWGSSNSRLQARPDCN